ncbi:hypothetical protein RUM44_001882 [Polyplax serrata]
MDEIYFHISRHFENLQICLTSCLQQGRHLAVSVHDELALHVQHLCSHSWGEQVNNAFRNFITLIRGAIQQCSTVFAHPNQMYSQLAELATVEMPVLYPGGAGFVIGAVVGLFLGLSWNHSTVPGQRMKAVVCMAYDGLDALSCVEDAVVPALTKPQQILIQVKSASVDITDIKISCGYGRFLRKYFNPSGRNELPITLGRDCAGIVVEIGPSVTKFEIGDKVWVALPFWSSGSLAEYIIATESMVSKKPESIDFDAASTLPYSGCLAYSVCLRAGIIGNNEKNKRVLIYSGVSPVGCIACQLAKFYDWEVIVTCSSRAEPFARALKTDQVIVYGNIEMENKLLQDRFDVVLNTVGGVSHEACLKLCKPGGVVVSTVPDHIFNDNYSFPLSLFQVVFLRLKCLLKRVFGNVNEWDGYDFSGETLDKLKDLVEKGGLQPIVDKIYNPEDAVRALQHCDSLDAIGKTIVRFR